MSFKGAWDAALVLLKAAMLLRFISLRKASIPMAASLCWGSAMYSCCGLLETLETLGLPLLLRTDVPESLSHMLPPYITTRHVSGPITR